MILGNTNSFFSQHSHSLVIADFSKQTNINVFHEHTQFPMLADILNRHSHHHIQLFFPFSTQIKTAWIEALFLFLRKSSLPKKLSQAEFLFLELESNFYLTKDKNKVEKDFQLFIQALNQQEKYLIMVSTDARWLLNNSDSTLFLQNQFQKLLKHPKFRLIIFTSQQDINYFFATEKIAIEKPTADEYFLLLKKYKYDLEKFHRVKINDAMIREAMHWSSLIYPEQNCFDICFKLLDSSAGRLTTPNEICLLQKQNIFNVLSEWTSIPSFYFEKTFNKNEMYHELNQKIIGQEIALTQLMNALHFLNDTALIRPNAFLFTGPANCGKQLTANYLSQYFAEDNLFFISCESQNVNTFLKIKVFNHEENHYFYLSDILTKKTPTFLYFKNIEKLATHLIIDLIEILKTASLLHQEKRFHFNLVHFIFETTAGSNTLATYAKASFAEISQSENDLETLLLTENTSGLCFTDYLNDNELNECLLLDLQKCLPPSFCKLINIIPFLPLSLNTIEKIINNEMLRLKNLIKEKNNIELLITPEVIHFLINEAIAIEESMAGSNALPKTLALLNEVITQAIQTQSITHSSNQLFVQLNETGQQMHFIWQQDSQVGT